MKSLPIYDADQAIACTITDAEKPERRELILRMRGAASRVRRTEDGVVLEFDPASRELFATFAELEKGCCAFFGFDVADTSLRWEAPPSASVLMDELHAFFADPSLPSDVLEEALRRLV